MAQTFGAVAFGLATWRPGLEFAGVIANRVGSAGHGRMLGAALPEGLRYFGALPRNEAVGIPDRHLGLVQAEEIEDLEQRLAAAADAVAEAEVIGLPEPVAFEPGRLPRPGRELDGVRIAIARDAAFAFLYPANLRLLEAMGAELTFFSPLAGERLPAADAVWLPGGYPELHLATLAANEGLKADLQAHHQAGRPILAECGGFLYLLESLADAEGHSAPMVGLLPGQAELAERVQGIGLQAAPLPEGELRGHTFHHSRAQVDREPIAHCIRARDRGSASEAIYRDGRLTATYLHAWFPSNPGAVAELLRP
jgi:cobyrinic acid a,c-diamide synthase